MTKRDSYSFTSVSFQKWSAIALATASLMGCAGSRHALQTPSSNPVEVDAARMDLKVIDTRGAPAADRVTLRAPVSLGVQESRRVPVGLTTGYKIAAAERLRDLVDGDGPTLELLIEVQRAELVWSFTVEGPAARVYVVIQLTVYDASGAVLQQGKAGAATAVEAADATPAELSRTVQATALNALDSYLARDETVTALSRALRNHG
jgi:hypothetical protein